MDLSERKRIILAAIIKNYIKTGEPVGSKLLIDLTGLGVSSATLRNEMSELCELGLLEQPHTSAGRKPTSLGYDFYFDKLMSRRTVPDDLKLIIDKMLGDAAKNPEQLSEVAGQVLSDLTGFPTITATISKSEAYVRRVDIMPMGRRSCVLFLITSDGLTRSRLCRSAFDLSPELILYFNRLVNVNIIGKELSLFTPAYLQSLVARSAELSLLLTPLISSVFEIIENLQSKTVSVKGKSNLMKCYGNENHTKALLGFLTREELLFSMLADVSGDIEIVFGDKTGIEELRPSNIIIAKYSIGGEDVGRIGVLGPQRMAYEYIIPSVEYFAYKLGEVTTNAIRDLEET